MQQLTPVLMVMAAILAFGAGHLVGQTREPGGRRYAPQWMVQVDGVELDGVSVELSAWPGIHGPVALAMSTSAYGVHLEQLSEGDHMVTLSLREYAYPAWITRHHVARRQRLSFEIRGKLAVVVFSQPLPERSTQ